MKKTVVLLVLLAILRHYKSEIPIHKLRELSGTDLEGTSALGLKKP